MTQDDETLDLPDLTRFEQKHQIPAGKRIEICGPIGAGKSTLARFIADHGGRLIGEPVAKHPYLQRFYAAPQKFVFEKALHFLVDYLHELKYNAEDPEALVLDAGYVYHSSFLKLGGFTPAEEEILDSMKALIRDSQGFADLTLRLTCPPDILLRRIARRGRDFEKGVSSDLLLALDEAIDTVIAEDLPQDRVMIIDSSAFDFQVPCAESHNLLGEIITRLTAKPQAQIQTPTARIPAHGPGRQDIDSPRQHRLAV